MGRFLSVKRTLEAGREFGWLIGKVEMPGRMFSHGFVTPTDLYGFADLIATIPGGKGVLFIQATAGANVSSHLEKMMEEDGVWQNVQTVLECGNAIELWCWVIRSPRGTKRKTRDAIRWKFYLKRGKLEAKRIEDFSELKRKLMG